MAGILEPTVTRIVVPILADSVVLTRTTAARQNDFTETTSECRHVIAVACKIAAFADRLARGTILAWVGAFTA